MAIKNLLVHLDDTPAAQARLTAGLALAEAFGAYVTALALVVEPYLRANPGRHLPTDFMREHVARLAQEADALLAAARTAAEQRGIELETRREAGTIDHLPNMLARHARHADLTLVG
jgi:nucleotide-binding universal stress UspA family protein